MKKISVLLLLFAVCTIFAGKVTFHCTCNKKDAVFKVGEEITFTAKILEDKQPAKNKKLGYRLMYDAKPIKCGVAEGTETLKFTVKATNPGWVSLKLYALGDSPRDKRYIRRMSNPNLYVTAKYIGGIGAVIEPDKLRHSKEEPADFDEFWNNVKKELAAVPGKELERKPIPEAYLKTQRLIKPERFNFFDVKVACAGQKPVSGYLCIPKKAKPKSLAVMVNFHGAGVFSARLNRYKYIIAEDLIVFDVNAHGVINGQPKSFYQNLSKKEYSGYPHFNKTDRNKFVFKEMYMRVLRALEYVKTLPEWNGKVLIVSGGSQGGAQSLVACALDHDVTLAQSKVPALSDHFAGLSKRSPGWPGLLTSRIQGVNIKDVEKCIAYYDCVYFAKRVKCPIYICTGFADTTCPPPGIFAVYNNIPSGVDKHMFHLPTAGHSVPTPNSWFYAAMRRHIEAAKAAR